ncbi:MAG: redoxin domain-containing protein [Alphaproteobacteria bacterium]|nr:redoxin domain-containing protein [Alphaproteobacteria bacterium]
MNKQLSLTEVLASLRDKQSPKWRSLYDTLVQHLVDEGAANDARKAGDKLPDFMLANAEGKFVRSEDLLAKGPVILSFYRGRWCPYCSAELDALNKVATSIRDSGATLAAVTAEAGGEAIRTKFERQFDFEILCDLDNGLALECGLVFKLTPEVQKAYIESNLELPKLYGNTSWFLPIPATYVVDRGGVIREAYVNPDFRYRLDPKAIMAVIEKLTA